MMLTPSGLGLTVTMVCSSLDSITVAVAELQRMLSLQQVTSSVNQKIVFLLGPMV
jgi:hypothetical protein